MELIPLYNGTCSPCSRIAKIINEESKKPIKVIPIGSPKAEKLLKEFYPQGAPLSYYFIEKMGGHNTCVLGIKAALRVAKYLPLRKKILVLSLFSSYKALMKLTSENTLPQYEVDESRRRFLRFLTIAPFILFLPKISLLTSGTSRSLSDYYTFLSNVRSKIDTAVAEDVKMDRPFRGTIEIDNPECLTIPCICDSSFCCKCSNLSCVQYCQNGCNSLNYIECMDSNGDECACTSDQDCLDCTSCLCYEPPIT